MPLADLFNHSDTHNIEFRTDHWVCTVCGSFQSCQHDEDDSLPSRAPAHPVTGSHQGAKATDDKDDTCEMWTCKSIERSEQAFNSYGPNLDNAHLVVNYGFVDEGNGNDRWYLPDPLGCAPESTSASIWRDVGLRPEHVERWKKRDQEQGALLSHTPEYAALIDTMCSSSRLDGSPLFFDAEALMSRSLWQLVAIISCPENDDPSASTQIDLAQAQLAIVSESEDAVMTADMKAWTHGFARTVFDLCATKRAAWQSPHFRANDLLDLADVMARADLHVEPGVDLENAKMERRAEIVAIRYCANERRLIECIESQYQLFL